MDMLIARRGKRRLLMLAGAVLALASGWHAMVMASRASRPAFALSLAPSEPIALARYQGPIIAQAIENKTSTARSVEPLRTSLREMALNSEALRLLAIAQAKSVSAPDYRLVSLANKISRRDLGTQILLIRQSGETGDVEQVLAAYDTALRTKRESKELLFPNLVTAIELPQAQAFFRDILTNDPPWLSDFLAFALSKTTRPELYYRAVIGTPAISAGAKGEELKNALLSRLVATGQLDLARKAYLSGSDARPSVLVSPAITEGSVGRNQNVLQWQLTDAAGVGAQVLGGQVLSAFADTGRKGVAASKVLYLAPGEYSLGAEIVDSGVATEGTFSWLSTCLGRPEGPVALGKIEPVSETSTDSSDRKWLLAMPSGCKALLISLEVYGGERAGGAEFNLQNLTLEKAR